MTLSEWLEAHHDPKWRPRRRPRKRGWGNRRIDRRSRWLVYAQHGATINLGHTDNRTLFPPARSIEEFIARKASSSL